MQVLFSKAKQKKQKKTTYLPDQKGSNLMIFTFPNPLQTVCVDKNDDNVCWELPYNGIEHMLFFFLLQYMRVVKNVQGL